MSPQAFPPMLASSRTVNCLHSYMHSAGRRVRNVSGTPQYLVRWWPAQQQQQQQRWTQQQRRQQSGLCATPGSGDDVDLDVAVFRFTLGIPGFEDSNIPRVVGAAVAALVVINHFLGAQPAPPAQVRAEFLDITLSVLCFVAPEVEARLRQVVPGRGRAGAGQAAGANQVFALADGQPESVRKELAWSSFVLLKNVNCCSMFLLQPAAGKVMMVRGSVAESVAAAGDAAEGRSRIEQVLSSSPTSATLFSQQQQQWYPDRSALKAAGLSSLGFVPSGAECALIQPLAGSSEAVLLVLGDRARALSDKDRKWVAAIAKKLEATL